MYELLLILAIAVAPPPAKNPGIVASQEGDHEESERILGKTKHSNDPKHNFYRLVNNFKLNKQKETIDYANRILHDWHGDVPQRYRDLAFIMKSEAEAWKFDRDDMEDISREMGKISDRLKHSRGGKETQKMQKDVLARLDKMIKDLENQKKKQEEDEQNKDGGGGGGQDKPGQDGKGGRSARPAQDTINPTEQGTGQVNPKKVREIAEVWGKLPEKERAAAMRSLTRNMPWKDRRVIEEYLKELQKRSGKK